MELPDADRAGSEADVVLKVDGQAIIARLDSRRQRQPQSVVVDLGMHVGQDRSARLQPPAPIDRFGDREMTGVRPMAKCIDDPQVEIGEKRQSSVRQTADIARIRGAADLETEGGDVAMNLEKRCELDPAARPIHLEGFLEDYRLALEDRRIEASRRRSETIAESFVEAGLGRIVGEDIDQFAVAMEIAAKIVDAVNMIGMRMGVDDAVQRIDAAKAQKLRPQIRRGVDERPGRTRRVGGEALDENAAPASAVPGLGRIAGPPIPVETRDAR